MYLADAIKKATSNKKSRTYPNRSDPRYRDACIFPSFNPKFGVDWATTGQVFTIGSCFARNIEDILAPMGIDLPTRKFSTPKNEWASRPNGLLNEYNPGSISQKIMASLSDDLVSSDTIFEQNGVYFDLLLHGGAGVTRDRALERRDEIAKIYSQMKTCEVVIITLGFIEAWYDHKAKQWLNRMPPVSRSTPKNRFTFRRLDVFQSFKLLSEAIKLLHSLEKKIILTVSPVPIGATFSDHDCVIANEFSKSVLRVCAERLYADFDNVDYFPSYEIVRSAGLAAYEDDNIHVKSEIVKNVTRYMVDSYQEKANGN